MGSSPSQLSLAGLALSGVESHGRFASSTVGLLRWHCTELPGPARRDKAQVGFSILVPDRGAFTIHTPRGRFLLDGNSAAFLHPGEPYRTSHFHGCHDRGLNLALTEEVLRDILRRRHPALADASEVYFPAAGQYITPTARLLQHEVRQHLARQPVEALACEETALELAESILLEPQAIRPQLGDGRDPRSDLIEAIRSLLGARFREPLRLAEIAAAVGRSTYHVSRAFREATGVALHRYQTRLRLSSALELIDQPRADLTEIALEVGFSSHSHFTAAFRREFGSPPSRVRARELAVA